MTRDAEKEEAHQDYSRREFFKARLAAELF